MQEEDKSPNLDLIPLSEATQEQLFQALQQNFSSYIFAGVPKCDNGYSADIWFNGRLIYQLGLLDYINTYYEEQRGEVDFSKFNNNE